MSIRQLPRLQSALDGARGLRQLASRGLYSVRSRGLSTEQVFSRIFTSNQWGSEASRSGQGSDDVQTAVVAAILPEVLRELGARSLLDLPCGDFHWMKRVDLGDIEYIGGDIVPAIVEANRRDYASPLRRFERLDLVSDGLPQADALLVRDCLVHLSNDLVHRALGNIRRSGAKWLLTTTFVDRTRNADIPTGSWRPLNLELAPFRLPKPRLLILEQCSEGNGSFADKALAVWPVDAIPA